MAPRKVDFALSAREAVTALAEAAERIAELCEIYFDSGYDALGSNPIVDEDIDGHDMTAQGLANFAALAENLDLFLNNGDPIVFDYQSKINAFREM
jgi:hypothetical protein